VGVSLLGACRFKFQRGQGTARQTYAVSVEPRSAYVLGGAARSAWQHAISPTKTLRYSVTFRTLRRPQAARRSAPPGLTDGVDRAAHGVANALTIRPAVGQQQDEADRRPTEKDGAVAGGEVGHEKAATAEAGAADFELAAQRRGQRRQRFDRDV